MGYPDQVRAELDAAISGMADHVGDWVARPGQDFTRERKLTFPRVMGMLVSMGPDAVGVEVAREFGYAADSPRAPAFCQARAKLRPEAARELLVRFTSRFPLGEHRGMCVVACDGSGLPVPRDSSEESTLVPPNRSSPRGRNAVHCTALYDLVGKRYLDCVVEPERERNEFAAFCEMCDRWAYGAVPLFVNDRGIASYNVYAHAIEAGAFFLIRLDDRKASRLLGRDVSGEGAFDESASLILSRSKSRRKMLQPDREADYRHVTPDVPLDYITEGSPEYEIDLRVARFPIGDGELENVVTNLPGGLFGADDLRDLYWMRWGIETSFRDLKHTVGAAAPHSSRLTLVAMEVWARMVLYNFGSVVAAHVVEAIGRKRGAKHWHRVNLAFTLKACHDFLRMDALARPPDLEGLIRRNTLPVKPGRKYERRLRFQVPPAFAYRFS